MDKDKLHGRIKALLENFEISIKGEALFVNRKAVTESFAKVIIEACQAEMKPNRMQACSEELQELATRNMKAEGRREAEEEFYDY